MKKILLLIVCAAAASLFSADPISPKQPERRTDARLSRHIWRAFGELSDAERKKMLHLQRENPAKFQEEMKKKAEAFFEAEKAEKKQFEDLVKKYRSTTDADSKEKIKSEIAQMLKKRFNKRLENNRKHIENMKRRTAILEQELDRRAANADKILEFQLNAVLEGKELRPPHRSGRWPERRPGSQLQRRNK